MADWGEMPKAQRSSAIAPGSSFPCVRQRWPPPPSPTALPKLIYPSLTRDDSSGKSKTSFVLLPRYRDCVSRITEHFGITKVTDSTLLRGFKAMRNWLVEALSFGRSSVALTAPGRQ